MDLEREIERLKRDVRRLRLVVGLAFILLLVAAAPSTRALQADRLVLGPVDAPWLVAENGRLELRSGTTPETRRRLVLAAGTPASNEPGPASMWLTSTKLIIQNEKGEAQFESNRASVMGVSEASLELFQQAREATIRLGAIDRAATLTVSSGGPGKSSALVRAHASASGSSDPAFARLMVSKDGTVTTLEADGVITR
jgi:hypothetical protein